MVKFLSCSDVWFHKTLETMRWSSIFTLYELFLVILDRTKPEYDTGLRVDGGDGGGDSTVEEDSAATADERRADGTS